MRKPNHLIQFMSDTEVAVRIRSIRRYLQSCPNSADRQDQLDDLSDFQLEQRIRRIRKGDFSDPPTTDSPDHSEKSKH